MKQKEIGIYVHIPFCKKKCSYCDFCSYENKEHLISDYIKALINEIEMVGVNNQIDYKNKKDDLFIVKTIYIGGGTPSLIDSSYIKQIMETIFENYEVSKQSEITIEVNPGTVSLDKLETYISSGINRISIGLQSTQNNLLETIGRIHNYYDFLDTYRFAREAGFKNINVDLMIGLPNQTLNDVLLTVNEIVSLEPEHISVYSLILEEGTKLYEEVSKGKLLLPKEDEERQMYWTTKKILENNGYIHYEISNFAKTNYESKHNLDCWKQKEYIGFGAAAHSYTNKIRYSNIEEIEQYIKNMQNDKIEENFVFQKNKIMKICKKNICY